MGAQESSGSGGDEVPVTFERLGRWLDFRTAQPRWLMIFLWTIITVNTINTILWVLR
jgi:hypothetical protein